MAELLRKGFLDAHSLTTYSTESFSGQGKSANRPNRKLVTLTVVVTREGSTVSPKMSGYKPPVAEGEVVPISCS
jgi:hypothetical protein